MGVLPTRGAPTPRRGLDDAPNQRAGALPDDPGRASPQVHVHHHAHGAGWDHRDVLRLAGLAGLPPDLSEPAHGSAVMGGDIRCGGVGRCRPVFRHLAGGQGGKAGSGGGAEV